MNSVSRPAAELPSASLLPLQLAVGLMFLATVAFHLFVTAKGYPDFRDQHLGTALVYGKNGVDLLRPVIVGFNATDTPTPLELPLWQATAGSLMRWFGLWPGWGNVTSLLFGAAALWPLYRLARTYGSERTAWWTLLFFAAQPVIFYYQGHGGTDGSCLTLMLYFLFFAERLVRTGAVRWFLPAAIFGILAAVTKAPFFFSAGIASFVLLLVYARGSWRTWLLLAAVGGLAAVVFLAWTHYTNVAVARAEFPLVDLRTSGGSESQSMHDWYFGDWHYRLNPRNWIKGGWRFMNATLGSYAFMALLGWGLVASKNRVGQALFIGGLITTLIFTHLVLHHTHYYLMFCPAVALLCGWGLGTLERVTPLRSGWLGAGGFVAIVTGAIFLSTIQGAVGIRLALLTDPYPHRVATLLQAHIKPEEKILIQGGGWGGQLLILSARQGLSIWDTEFLAQSKNLQRIQELGFTKLVMISESPMLVALQQANPGQSDQKRDTYAAHLTSAAQPWVTVLETEDVLIKEIPRKTAAP